VEYKKTSKDTVINQGLFYLDWLVDHKGDFTLAAQDVFGSEVLIDWSNPRLILVAESFSDYDKYAVNRIGANIELWIYRRYEENYLYLDPLFVTTSTKSKKSTDKVEEEVIDEEPIYTVDGHLEGKPEATIELFELLRERIFAFADDESIVEKAVKNYIVYKHGKNFCEVWVQASKLKLWLDIAPSELNDPLGMARDVTNVGHWGTGEVEVTFEDTGQIDAISTLVEQAYQQTV
jgi:predicted transport protein